MEQANAIKSLPQAPVSDAIMVQEADSDDVPKVDKIRNQVKEVHIDDDYAVPLVCSDKVTPWPEFPEGAVPLELSCPSRRCKSGEVYFWVCSKTTCRAILLFDFQCCVYCPCGRSNVSDLRFRCPTHEDEAYTKPDMDLLRDSLGAILPPKKINILILGETGVGKSTWINGFVNFLHSDTLEAAQEGPLKTLVHTQFTVYNDNFEEIVVTTGLDENEVLSAGQSATQSAQKYEFQVGRNTVNIIDTPGIGDSRGPTKDQENFENILATLAHIDELHGICILLKPNNARLNIMFRFCIKELLTYLHRDASRNIVFCFTNSRGTFYRPGDTMPALLKLLKENKDVEIPVNKDNVFCYDSEAYRFLAATKNNPPVSFSADEQENFSNSWKKSIQETHRMLDYISRLQPHIIKNTLNLNNTRQLVLKLARPLAEINRNIQTNKKIQKDHTQEILKTDENIKELRKKRKTTRISIRVKELNYPKTVCSDSSCVKVWKLDGNVSTNEYVKICHEHCYLSGVPMDTIGHHGLMGCYAMRNNNCRFCGHSYRQHLHVYYDSVQFSEEVVDQNVDQEIKKGCSAKELKEKMLENQKILLAEYDAEIKTIEKSCAHFAQFLKMNAITPYNDAVEQYFDHFIQEEQEKIKQGGDSKTVLDDLVRSKNSYIEQKRILDDSLRTGAGLKGSEPVKQEDIWRMVKELENLKHSGKMLKDALACVNFTQSSSSSSRVKGKGASTNLLESGVQMAMQVYKGVKTFLKP